MNERPTVVQFGAGAIGRGFVGQLWTSAGYEVVFVDVDPSLIASINDRGSYPLRLAGFDSVVQDCAIAPVRAIDARDTDAVADAIADAAFACTAVGASVFRHLAPAIARGIYTRFESGRRDALNVICCENQWKAGAELRSTVVERLPEDPGIRSYFDSLIGFVDASVGRMVPPATRELLEEDPLLLLAEPYSKLPIDAAAWIGPAPAIAGLQSKENFAGYIARKLFMHNGGHAALAYHGHKAGLTYIWEAVEDSRISAELTGFWHESGAALIAAYGFDSREQRDYENDLRQRFTNRALGDTTQRVARDPLRKLRAEDRLVGAALLCRKHTPRTEPVHVCAAIAAALRYRNIADPAAVSLQEMIAAHGLPFVLENVCGIDPDSAIGLTIEAHYRAAPP